MVTSTVRALVVGLARLPCPCTRRHCFLARAACGWRGRLAVRAPSSPSPRTHTVILVVAVLASRFPRPLTPCPRAALQRSFSSRFGAPAGVCGPDELTPSSRGLISELCQRCDLASAGPCGVCAPHCVCVCVCRFSNVLALDAVAATPGKHPAALADIELGPCPCFGVKGGASIGLFCFPARVCVCVPPPTVPVRPCVSPPTIVIEAHGSQSSASLLRHARALTAGAPLSPRARVCVWSCVCV